MMRCDVAMTFWKRSRQHQLQHSVFTTREQNVYKLPLSLSLAFVLEYRLLGPGQLVFLARKNSKLINASPRSFTPWQIVLYILAMFSRSVFIFERTPPMPETFLDDASIRGKEIRRIRREEVKL